MERGIVEWCRDEHGDWVAVLGCGHRQHVRHRPPFIERPWVEEPAGRAGRIGTSLDCPLCDRAEQPEGPATMRSGPVRDETTVAGGLPDEGGEPACLAHRVCPDCGAVLDGAAGHRRGCPAVGA